MFGVDEDIGDVVAVFVFPVGESPVAEFGLVLGCVELVWEGRCEWPFPEFVVIIER